MTQGGGWLGRGQILGDRYRVDETLGSGGMGLVVAAMDLQRSQRVALKVPHRDRIRTTRDVTRFVREARSAERLTSQHVPRIYETGTFRTGDLTIPFIALEYLEGADLATWLAAHGRVSVATAAALVVQACHAIAEAHVLGIVHRDLKPANLFLTTTPAGDLVVKVLDFGISKARADSSNGITTTGALLGSPAYMPPEQMRPSTTVDSRGDLWSLGVVLFEAVTGRLPFESAVFPDLCLKILLDDVPPLPADCAAPPAFLDVIRRCLEKDPDARYQSAAALAEALAPFMDPSPMISALDLELLAVAPRGTADEPAETFAPPPNRRAAPWSRWATILAVAVVIFGMRDAGSDAASVLVPDIRVASAPEPPMRSRVTRSESAAPPPATVIGATTADHRRKTSVPSLEPAPLPEPIQVVERPATRDPLASPF